MQSSNSILTILKASLVGVTMLLLSNSSCKKDNLNGTKNIKFDTAFELELNKKATLGTDNIEVIVDFVNVTDSRCPVNVNCIWAGNVSVNLSLSDLENIKSEAVLCLGQCDKKFKMADTTVVSLNRTNYTLILKDVKPYPGTSQLGEKKATLIVKKE